MACRGVSQIRVKSGDIRKVVLLPLAPSLAAYILSRIIS